MFVRRPCTYVYLGFRICWNIGVFLNPEKEIAQTYLRKSRLFSKIASWKKRGMSVLIIFSNFGSPSWNLNYPYYHNRYNTGKFDYKNRFCTMIEIFIYIFFRIISGMDLSRESFTNKKSSSLLYYTPKSQMDYGTVLCVASNIVGRQIVPCIYHVIPAGMTQFFLDRIYFCYKVNIFY